MPTLALLLILCFAAGAVESLQNAPPNFTLGGWPGPALAGTQSIAAALAGVQTLRRNLSCGILVGSGNPGTLWAQVKPNSPSLTNIAAAAYGSATPVPGSEVQGAAVWLLRDFLSQYNVTVDFFAVKPPVGLTYPNTSDPTPGLMFALDDMGLDCVAQVIPLTASQMGVMSFSVPLISGSFVVIGRRPEPPPAAIVDRLRAAYIPFTGYTWLLVGGLLVTSAIVMMTFEYGVKEAIGEGWDHTKSYGYHAIRFLGVAMVTMTGHGFFEPASSAGRAYAAMKAFFVVILWGVFVGNMTAYLDVQPKYIERVTGVTDFAIADGVGTPACLLDREDIQQYMQEFQTFTPTRVLSTQRPDDIVQAVSSGACDGAVLYDADFAEALGGSNTVTKFCNVEQKGAALSTFTFAMPFSQHLGLGSFGRPVPGQGPDPAWWVGLNKLFIYAAETSQLQQQGLEPWYQLTPAACAGALNAGQDLREMSFIQLTEYHLSGIFLLQIGGLVIACLVHCCTFLDRAWQDRHQRQSQGGSPKHKIKAIMSD